MCLTFDIRVEHFFGMLEKKSIYTKYLCLLSQISAPGLPDLGAQIRHAQNQYTAVQTDLKYPLQGTVFCPYQMLPSHFRLGPDSDHDLLLKL